MTSPQCCFRDYTGRASPGYAGIAISGDIQRCPNEATTEIRCKEFTNRGRKYRNDPDWVILVCDKHVKVYVDEKHPESSMYAADPIGVLA